MIYLIKNHDARDVRDAHYYAQILDFVHNHIPNFFRNRFGIKPEF